ncbi:MurR/RpiR family transcriptional regulator [Enterocloster lavalensis]|uniref:MurR/RpiR family transcriptional regulator n=1 Tax=Enterocloster lavalensis TaxID=460384 RepID=UPI0026671CA3|nr:MurR/RpiR family transcriptional regulator [Enterocloster lavalensis]
MNILTMLQNLDGLTSTEARLTEYILKNPLEFISISPKEIPTKVFVSLPTVYRLIHKLGLNGINDFKLELKSALRNESEALVKNVNFPIDPLASVNEILLRLKDVYEYTIADTLETAIPATLFQVSELMASCSAIDVYAFAGNIFFADNFKFQMQEIGVNVNVPHVDYMQKLTAGNSDSTHLSIVISFAGRANASEMLCKILKDRRSPIVLIASTQNKTLTRYAKHVIYMSSYEDHYQKISSFSTRMTLLYILDTLYAVYFSRHYRDNVQKKLKTYELLHGFDTRILRDNQRTKPNP